MLTRNQLEKQSSDLKVDIHNLQLNETAAHELFSIAEKYCSQEIKPVALHIIYTFALIKKANEMIAKLHDLQK
jgi:hypothetical protein